jgi:hypothetical protein
MRFLRSGWSFSGPTTSRRCGCGPRGQTSAGKKPSGMMFVALFHAVNRRIIDVAIPVHWCTHAIRQDISRAERPAAINRSSEVW